MIIKTMFNLIKLTFIKKNYGLKKEYLLGNESLLMTFGNIGILVTIQYR
jgi:hypothetical protein